MSVFWNQDLGMAIETVVSVYLNANNGLWVIVIIENWITTVADLTRMLCLAIRLL